MGSRKARNPAEIPDKSYFRIGEVAAIAGVAPSVLRFWETQFRSLSPEKTRSNQRVYARRHVEAVLVIRELLYDRGFTIAGARQHLRRAPAPAPETDAGALPADVVADLKKEVQDLLRLCDE